VYERIGAGGMATVHRAETRGVEGFSRVVALKRLLPQVSEDPAMVQSFVHEARLASQLHHANVAQTYDLGKVEDTYFIAMEYVPGPTLGQLVKQCAAASGSMPIPIALAILVQICDALDHAHNLCDDQGTPLGIIHRDVSPSNIIVSNTGIVKLIDFGIAKAANSGTKTQAGFIKGKFAYIAPEYTHGHLDLRADLFGVGVIAHELLTTRPLFHSDNDFDTIMKLREMPIQPPSRWNPQVSRVIDDIVITALQRDPSLRWQSADAMRTALVNAARSTDEVVNNQQIVEWTEWAFTKKPRQDEGVLRVLDMLSEPSSVTHEISIEQLDELERHTPPPTVAKAQPVITAAGPAVTAGKVPDTEESGLLIVPPRARRRRAWPVLLVLLGLLAGGAGYYLYLTDQLPFEIPFEL